MGPGTKELFNLPPLVLKARHLWGSAFCILGLGLPGTGNGMQGRTHNFQSGGRGLCDNCARSVRKFFDAIVSRTLKMH